MVIEEFFFARFFIARHKLIIDITKKNNIKIWAQV